MKAYEAVNASELRYLYSTTSNSDTFWSMTAYFHSQIPYLSESGLYGYYSVYPDDPLVKNAARKGQVLGIWVGPGLTADEMKAIVAPMEDYMRTANWGDQVFLGNTTTASQNFMKLVRIPKGGRPPKV